LSKAERAKELRALIERYRNAYYLENESLVSDSEYDALEQELRALEQENPELIVDSPTEKVGGEASSLFAPHRHLEPMLSLDKRVLTGGAVGMGPEGWRWSIPLRTKD
jgi:DNA ligase (NAD+)